MTIKNLATCQPYFRAYCLAKGLRDDDEAKGYQYMDWVEGKQLEFRIDHGYPDLQLPLYPDDRKLFEEWLFSEARKEVGT